MVLAVFGDEVLLVLSFAVNLQQRVLWGFSMQRLGLLINLLLGPVDATFMHIEHLFVPLAHVDLDQIVSRLERLVNDLPLHLFLTLDFMPF